MLPLAHHRRKHRLLVPAALDSPYLSLSLSVGIYMSLSTADVSIYEQLLKKYVTNVKARCLIWESGLEKITLLHALRDSNSVYEEG